MRKAIILCDENTMDRGEVVNIIVCGEKGIEGINLPLNRILSDCTNFDVAVGYRWENGRFFKGDGTLADDSKTNEEKDIEMLKKETSSLKMQNADIAEAVLNLEMGGEI